MDSNLFVSNSPLETPDPFDEPLSKLAQSQNGKYFVWKHKDHQTFLDWWLQTSWVINQNVDKDDLVRKLRWDSSSRTSQVWQQFDQVADQKTGTPWVLCRKCQGKAVLVHPCVRNTGTHSMSTHLTSKQCDRGSGRKSIGEDRQTTIQETLHSVSMITIKISIKTNNDSRNA